jgi:hypothetical protein
LEHQQLMAQRENLECSAIRDRTTPRSTAKQKSPRAASPVSVSVRSDKFNDANM